MMTKSKTRKIRWSFIIFFIPVALWLFLLIVLPHFELLRISLTSTST
ncbi:MAG: ABC transporter permease, partial [Spirochaetes bacterium]